MTASEVTALVEQEIDGQWAETNLHGVDLRASLLPPIRTRFISRSVHDGVVREALVDAWLVLEERPDTRDGYKIGYDDQTDEFGIASPGFAHDPHPCIVGWYGEFWTTFKGR